MKNGNFKSLSKDQAQKCISFFLREAFNYKNFDEHGRYIPKSTRKNNRKIFNNNKNMENSMQNKLHTTVSTDDMAKALNIGNNFFEKQFRLEKVESNKQIQNTSESNENQKSDINQQISTNDSTPPIIKLSDEQTLNMILKITFIILDFVKGALEDSNEDE